MQDVAHQIWSFIQQTFTLDPQEPLRFAAKVAAILGASATVLVTLVSKTYPWLRTKIESRSVSKIFGEDLFPPKSIEKAIRYYIPPLCQSIDPAGGEESRLIHSVQAPLFETFDKALSSESETKYFILLADSGMGKTSAVTNYCVRHQHRLRKKYHVAMIPLGIPDADERIKKIENKAKTSLFLDALDEDTLAMVDHVERIRLLIRDTHEFRKVIITCRTQFFSNDEEIPRETGVLKITVRSAGESAEQLFYKIYLAPFSDELVKAYLKRCYPFWQRKRRKQAFQMVAKIPLLTARPMLLAHIDDLVRSHRDFQFSYQLYEEMVEAWIEREKGFVENSDALRDFSERLAADLYLNRAKRGAERIPKGELKQLANEWGIPISDHKLSERSLLNRYADGHCKFAHRSIMEHLFIQRFLHNDHRCLTVEWTDQMKTFMWERCQNAISRGPGVMNRNLLPDSLLTDQMLDVLRNVLMFAVQTSGPTVLADFRSLTTRAIVLLCGWILECQVRCPIVVTLWHSSNVYHHAQALWFPLCEAFELVDARGLRYEAGSISRDHRIIQLFFTDEAMLLDFYPALSEGRNATQTNDALEFAEVLNRVEDALNEDPKHGRFLVVPISFGGHPEFVFVAEVPRGSPQSRPNEALLSFSEEQRTFFSDAFLSGF